MKKLLLIGICAVGLVNAQEEPVIVDVFAGESSVCQVTLEPGQSVEIERLVGYETGIEVQRNGVVSRVSSSLFQTMHDNPLCSALAFWALAFSRDSIKNNWFISTIVGGFLLSDFALHMLHSADQKITITE